MSTTARASLKFSRSNEFRKTLNARVDGYFDDTGHSRRDLPHHFLKIFVIFSWFVGSYLLLVFAPLPVFGKVLAAISLGFAGAGMGFSVMHDAGHGAASSKPWVNRVLFCSLEILGGSSFLWNVKHNMVHHTYANVDGHDDDIDMGFLGRLAPEQRHLPFHRAQHFYIWFLYGLLVLKWHLIDDFRMLLKGRIGERKIPAMKPSDIAIFVGGKIFFISYAFVIPTLIFGFLPVFAFYMIASFVQGVTMATVFQLAHCVEEADFPAAPEEHRFDHDWATHQVLTTVDFAQNSRFINWYVGGLNFQIEHHLFPRISHMHYPALAPLVRQTCEEFGLPYHVQPGFGHALRSHFRWLRRMGRPTAPSMATAG